MKKYTKEQIELRIKKLTNKPIENEKLIKKWQRMLRTIEE